MTATSKSNKKDQKAPEFKSFSDAVKYCYHELGLKTNEEVYNKLVELKVIKAEDDEKKSRNKVRNIMWAVRTPEDSQYASSRSTNGTLRVERLKHHLLALGDRTEAWKAMHAEVADGGEFAGQYEAPNKKWVIDTTWRLCKKHPEVQAKMHPEAEEKTAESTSDDTPAATGSEVVKADNKDQKGKGGNGKKEKESAA